MLGNRKNRAGNSGSTTLIAHDTVIQGDVRFHGNLDIEGVVQGNIIAEPERDALVRVIGNGRVEGEIHAPCVVINGQVKGNVHSTEQLELAPKARVEGDVFYALVEMAAGASVNGGVTHVNPDAGEAGQDVAGPDVD